MITYFAYARKSTESDERQIQSIADQITWIKDKTNNEPFKLYTESKSAKDPGVRIQFDKMMKDIQKTKWEIYLICWKLDRLSRNPVDSWMVQFLLQRWKLHKIITNDREYFPVDSWLLMSVENAMSNQFILDMVKNVARWMKSKIEKWWCIQNVPLWYINNKNTKQADIDNITAPFIKEIFFLRASWNSLNIIADKMNKKGLRGQRWWVITKSTIEQIIKNPFYIWLQKFQWKLYKSIHEKIVSVEVWEKVNGIKRWYKKHNAEVEFPLKWIVKNWHTKKPLLWLWKKDKYVYYSTHSRDEYIINMNQNHIIEAFDDIIDNYCLPEEYTPFILKELKSCLNVFYKDLKDKKAALNLKLKDLNIKSEKLFDLVLKWTIADEKYKSVNNEIILEQNQIEEELSNLNNLDLIIIDEAKDLVELLVNLKDKRKTANNNKKAKIISFIMVELFIDTKKQLYIQENELFEYIKVLNGLKWQGPLELHQRLSGSESEHSSN